VTVFSPAGQRSKVNVKVKVTVAQLQADGRIIYARLRVSSFFKFSAVTSTRGHQYKLHKSHCSHSTRSRFFLPREL